MIPGLQDVVDFERLLCRDVFGKGAETVQKLSECSEDGAMLADVLAHLFYLPIRHLHEYSHLLLKLTSCYNPVRVSVMSLLNK